MADKTWFSGLSDANLENTAVIKTPDMYIQEELVTSSIAVWDDTAKTFTVAGASWTVDAFISAGVDNILVIDDNGVAASTIVTDNDATTATIVDTNLLLESDGTTAASLTDAGVYEIKILTPGTSSQPYGKFIGYTEAVDLQITDEYAKFKYSVPRALKFKDLLERQVILSGGIINIANTDVLKTIFNAVDYGDNTTSGVYGLGIGSNPGSSPAYRIWLNGTDRVGGNLTWMLRKGQFESTGSVLGDAESGHKLANFTIDAISDGFYPADSDLLQIIGTEY